MQKVVSISLNGIAYQLEEPGYNQLRAYLERAESRLKDNPDRTEVMNDLEQAIGEKCARSLSPRSRIPGRSRASACSISAKAQCGPACATASPRTSMWTSPGCASPSR